MKNICLIRKSGLNNLLKSSAIRHNVTLFINSSPIKARKQSNQNMKNFNHYAGREEFSAFKDFFLTHGQCKEMKKKEYFTLQGALATHGAYIEEGLFRYICTDDRGYEHIVGYSFAGEYVGDYPACLKKRKLW